MNEYFFSQMRELLGERYNDFRVAYDTKPRYKALRVNTSKISVADFVALAERYEKSGVRTYGLRQNPLCAQSFYTEVKPSRDPLYHAGLYYMQEPAASAAVAAFSQFIGERVLDLCSAPGGKGTQAAAFLDGGCIFLNDVEYDRVFGALKENTERLGVSDAVLTCGDAKDFRAAGFDGYFDTLIIDAPCSGGSMMRYENVLYTPQAVAGCARRQKEIVTEGAKLLAGGGYLLYSTCTFAPEEDEEIVRHIISLGFEPVDVPLLPGVERGIDMPEARRIYPHNFDGEGHFYCVLKKLVPAESAMRAEKKPVRSAVKIGGYAACAVTDKSGAFLRDFDMPSIADYGRQRLVVYSAGVPVYDMRGAKNKEFSHALSHALSAPDVERVGRVELGALAEDYIRGKQIDIEMPPGLYIATVDGYALGWVRSARSGDGGMALKNLYPKKLRIQ